MDELVLEKLFAAAHLLFEEKGFDVVGMRELASCIDMQPTQLYRLNLGKSDILAEVILRHNARQIKTLPLLVKQIKGGTTHKKVCSYLQLLYEEDIADIQIRSVGASYGWTWGTKYEVQIINQVFQYLSPIQKWLEQKELDNINDRCLGIWSLYYVGFRGAVVHQRDAKECVDGIKGALKILCE